MPNKNMSERLSRVLKNFAFFDGASDVFAQLVKDQAFNDYIEKEKTDLVFGLCSYSCLFLSLRPKREYKCI